MGLIIKELMPFEKFVTSHLKLLFHSEKRMIQGTFKEKNTGQVVKGDNFNANLVGRSTAEETYKAYLEWFNFTIEDKEDEREYVFARFESEVEEK